MAELSNLRPPRPAGDEPAGAGVIRTDDGRIRAADPTTPTGPARLARYTVPELRRELLGFRVDTAVRAIAQNLQALDRHLRVEARWKRLPSPPHSLCIQEGLLHALDLLELALTRGHPPPSPGALAYLDRALARVERVPDDVHRAISTTLITNGLRA